MARALKPTKAGEARHERYQVTIDVMLNRNTNIFFAEFGGEKVEDATYAGAERKAIDMIERLSQIEWQPVIKVEPFGSFFDDKNPGVGLKASRFYVAPKPGTDGYIMAGWEPSEYANRNQTKEERAGQFWWHGEGGFVPPCLYKERYSATTTYYFPYSDDLWSRLARTQGAIRQLRDQMKEALDAFEPERLNAGIVQEVKP